MRRNSLQIAAVSLAALAMGAAFGCKRPASPTAAAGAPAAPVSAVSKSDGPGEATAAADAAPGEPSPPDGPGAEAAHRSPTAPPPGTSTRPAAGSGAIRWSFSPETLDVYRDTRIAFRVDPPAAIAPGWHCVWDFGDGSPRADGCQVRHLFRGGQSDYLATLTVMDGERNVYLGSRTVPLERLPVVPLREDDEGFAPDLSIPPPPPRGETTFRLVVISDSNGPYGSLPQGAHAAAAIDRIVRELHPHLVVHDGDMIAGQQRGLSREHLQRMWAAYHDTITHPLMAAGIPLVPVPGNHDASPNLIDREVYIAQWTREAYRPRVTMIDDADYPIRYSFTYAGAFFLVMDGATGRVTNEQVRWVRGQLGDTRIYTTRFVFTHVPLHKFTEVRFGNLRNPEEAHDPLRKPAEMDRVESAGLEKHFRLYNLFLEHNVTMLISGHYEVYFKGRYGALRVISTGNIAGTRRALSGQRVKQGASFVVIDVVDGRVKYAFAVAGPDYTRRFDESVLPEEVEDYRYDPTFTPGLARGGELPAGILDD